MKKTDPSDPPVDEFDLIARLMRPLTNGAPEALGLLDDAAVLAPRPAEDWVATADMIVEGVHFLPTDPMDLVARKLLRVNLSDLAAKGARPYAYFLTMAWPPGRSWSDREAFAHGLRQDQDAFGLSLLGGDTVSTPGPLTLSATMLGRVPAGQAVLRSGARPGDLLVVSGCIGDGWLGLQIALGRLKSIGKEDRDAALERYRLPAPRSALGDLLRARASAAADVSDGLLADAGHIALASAAAIEIDLDRVPLSSAGAAYAARGADRTQRVLRLCTGGDDYEIVLTVAAGDAPDLIEQAAGLAVPLTVIGRVVEGRGVRVLSDDRQIRVARTGYRHS